MRKLLVWLLGIVLVLVLAVVVAALVIDPNDYRERIASQLSETLQRPVALEGPIDLTVFPWLALEIRDFTIGNPEGMPADRPLLHAGRAKASVRVLPLLTGAVETGALELEDTQLNLITAASGTTNLEGLGGQQQTETQTTAPQQLAIGPLRLRDLTLRSIDLGQGTEQVFELKRLDLERFRFGALVDFSMAGVLSDQDQILVDDFKASGTINVSGALDRVGVSDFDLGGRLPAQAMDLGVSGDFEGQLRPSLDLQLSDTVLDLGGQKLTVNGRYSDGPSLNAEVTGDRLDLDRLLPQGAAGGGDTPTADQPAAGPIEVPPIVKQLRLDAGLELGELRTGRLQLTDVTGQLTGRNGVFRVSPLQASMLGGRIAADASVDLTADPPRLELKPRMEQVGLANLAETLGGALPIEGAGNLRLDISASGLDAQSLLRSLDGSGSLNVSGGALRGVDLPKLFRQDMSLANLRNLAGSFSGKTSFQQLDSSFSIQDGVVNTPDLNIRSELLDLSGSGQLNLAARNLDTDLKLKLKGALLERLSPDLKELTGGVLPLSLSGPVTSPKVGFDVAGLVEGRVRGEVEKQTDKLKQGLLDRVRGGDDQAGEGESDDGSAQSVEERGKQALDSLLGGDRKRADDQPQSGEDNGGAGSDGSREQPQAQSAEEQVEEEGRKVLNSLFGGGKKKDEGQEQSEDDGGGGGGTALIH